MATEKKAGSGKPAKSTVKSSASAKSLEFTPDEEIESYGQMLLIRSFEEKAGQMYGMGVIGGFCHL